MRVFFSPVHIHSNVCHVCWYPKEDPISILMSTLHYMSPSQREEVKEQKDLKEPSQKVRDVSSQVVAHHLDA